MSDTPVDPVVSKPPHSEQTEDSGRLRRVWPLRRRGPAVSLGLGVVLLVAGATGIVVVASRGPSGAVVLHPTNSVRGAAPQAFASLTPLPCPVITAAPVPAQHEFGSSGSSVYLKAADQTGDGRRILIDDVRLAQPGYVVVHDVDCGQPGQIIGVTALLPPGEHRGVIVPLTTPLTSGTQDVFLMLHAEDNGDTTFDYPNADMPVTVNGQIVTFPVWVSVVT